MFNLFQLRKRASLKKESEKGKVKKETKKEVVIEKVKKEEPKKVKPTVFVSKKETVKKPIDDEKTDNPNSKKIFAYVGKKLVGDYDSITKCGVALGMPRSAVKKAIESGETLDNGFKLKFK